jgi:hypothetical protein
VINYTATANLADKSEGFTDTYPRTDADGDAVQITENLVRE